MRRTPACRPAGMTAIVLPPVVVYAVVVVPPSRLAIRTAVGCGAPSTPGELTPYANVLLAVAVAGAVATSRQSSVPVGGVTTVIAWGAGSSSHRPIESG